MIKKPNNLVIGIYFHPEAYPPTLNAVDELSECFDYISLVHRPHLTSTWKYPHNLRMISAGKHMDIEQQKTASFIKKINFFIQFVHIFYKECKREKPACILVYDSISLYAYHLLKPLLFFKHKLWYHNHDVLERSLLKKFSIGWLAARAETKAFKYLDIFSLPSNDRKKFFPLDTFTGRYFFVPNFPSKKFYGKFYNHRKLEKTVRIIFQGQVAPLRGIEEMLPLLSTFINGYSLQLALIGPCGNDYKDEIINLMTRYDVMDKVHFDRLPYSKLPERSATFNIGLALLSQKDIMTSTIGTASNKLYEYAAVGLPVIYYNSEYLNSYLGKFAWAIPADLTTESIRDAIIRIISHYDDLCIAAHQDFLNDLNFENGFAPLKKYLTANESGKSENSEVAARFTAPVNRKL